MRKCKFKVSNTVVLFFLNELNSFKNQLTLAVKSKIYYLLSDQKLLNIVIHLLKYVTININIPA